MKIKDTVTLINASESTDMLTGSIEANEILRICLKHGLFKLLEKNPRLPVTKWRKNHKVPDSPGASVSMVKTLQDPSRQEQFAKFHQGIKVICDDFKITSNGSKPVKIQVDDFQIVNGGQTCDVLIKVDARGTNLSKVSIPIHIIKGEGTDLVAVTSNHQTRLNKFGLAARKETNQRLQEEINKGNFKVFYRLRNESPPDNDKGKLIADTSDFAKAMTGFRGDPARAKNSAGQIADGIVNDKPIYTDLFNEDTTVYDLMLPLQTLVKITERKQRQQRMDKTAQQMRPEWLSYADMFMLGYVGRGFMAKKMSVSKKAYETMDQWFDQLYEVGAKTINHTIVDEKHASERKRVHFQVPNALKSNGVWQRSLPVFDEYISQVL